MSKKIKEEKTGIANRGKRPNPTNKEKVERLSSGRGVDGFSFDYSITVNQYAVLKNKWDLDFIDVAVFWTIFNFIGSGYCERIIDNNNNTWYWVSEKLIIQHLPLIPINSSSSVNNRISNLCKCDLIERNPDNRKNGKKHIRIGKNSQLLLFTPKELNNN